MKKYIFIFFALIIGSLPSCAFQVQNQISDSKSEQSFPSFVEAKKDFPREEKNLRKWDAPVVADLDQDGFLDLVLNDHGLGIKISWNNKGKFAKPYDLIMGDIHGVTVGDFDMDGNLEMVLSRGGGSGSNARNSKIYRVDLERNFTALPDFKIPLEMMRGRTVSFIDGDNDGDLDLLNFAFPDKEKKGASENYVYKNDGNGQLILSSTLPPSKKDGQKTFRTDFNGDNIVDILLYGEGKVRAFQGKGDLTYDEVTDKIFPTEIKEVTSIVEMDYDNDGDFDLFFTRGKDFEKGETFYDAQSEILGFATKRGEFNFDNIKVGDVLNLENYHTQWPQTNQLYIGETGYDYEHPGETHSGKDLRIVNSDALGFPDNFSKKGIYIGYVGNQNWRIAGKIWGPLTAVIHGVKQYENSEHPKGLQDFLLENKNGKFVDVTKNANLLLKEHTVGATVADFDNNGFQDLLIIRRGDLIYKNKSLIYLNYGKSRFEKLENHNIISTELGAIGMCIESFDYNHDGKVDVILGNERGKWHLFKNTLPTTKNTNHLVVEVGHSNSGKATALGALVTIESCGQNQIKTVGSTGAAYSLSFNPFVHFGLGNCEQKVKVKVVWSNGETLEQTVSKKNSKTFLGR